MGVCSTDTCSTDTACDQVRVLCSRPTYIFGYYWLHECMPTWIIINTRRVYANLDYNKHSPYCWRVSLISKIVYKVTVYRAITFQRGSNTIPLWTCDYTYRILARLARCGAHTTSAGQARRRTLHIIRSLLDSSTWTQMKQSESFPYASRKSRKFRPWTLNSNKPHLLGWKMSQKSNGAGWLWIIKQMKSVAEAVTHYSTHRDRSRDYFKLNLCVWPILRVHPKQLPGEYCWKYNVWTLDYTVALFLNVDSSEIIIQSDTVHSLKRNK